MNNALPVPFGKLVLLALAAIALVSAVVWSPSLVSGASIVVQDRMEAEALGTAPGTRAYGESAANGGEAVKLFRSTTLKTVISTGTIRSITVRASGSQCEGAPWLGISIDGFLTRTASVPNTSWRDFTFQIDGVAGTGRRVIGIMFGNDLYRPGTCDRNLNIDSVTVESVQEIATATPRPSAPAAATPTPAPVINKRLAVNWNNPAMRQAESWRATRPADAALLDKIGSKSIASWMGDWSGEAKRLASLVSNAKAQDARLVLVVYGIPFRDAGGYSAGGHEDAASYKAWIDSIAAAVGSTPALTVVEPDAASMDVPPAMRAERNELLRYAVTKLNALPDNLVYLDAGTPGWRSAPEMVTRLTNAGIDAADGFSLNVSNYVDTKTVLRYGFDLREGLGNDKTFIVDTSRNGNGSFVGEDSWCNPPGRAVGDPPTMNTGVANVDAFIWAKTPGSSDGTCRNWPTAGTFQPDAALEMIRNAKW